MTAVLSLTALILGISFLFLEHPLSFGLILLIETMIISVLTGMMNFNFWFSYILFLVMVGGMLILFIYMTSVASNEKFKFSIKLTFFIFMEILVLTMMIIALDLYFPNLWITNYDLTEGKGNSLSMSKYINLEENMIMFMMIIYLLIALIMVVKITNIKYGPLRQKF